MVLEIRHDLIKPFVQGKLGCQCPVEVFEQIESSIEAMDEYMYQRILTGERLLVYLAADASLGQLMQLMIMGRDERDKRGYNRFRLAVVGRYTEQEVDPVLEQVQPDEKAHLHLLASSHLANYI